MKASLAALAAAALIALTPSPAAAAEDDVTWTVRTASNSYGDDRSSFSYAVDPGGKAEDAMVVANRGKDPLTLVVYAADGFTTGTGQLDLQAQATKPTGIGSFVKPASAGVTVQPGKTASVPFTVTVPQNATPGDYVGGIVTSLTSPDNTAMVNVDRRLGIRVALRVGGELQPALAIEKPALSWSDGAATLTYTLHNTGNTVLSARQEASIAGPFGWFRRDADAVAAPPDLLPGETWAVTVPLADVTAAFRLEATTTVTPLLTDASGSTTSLDPVRADAVAWAVPWLWVVVALVVIAAVVAVILLVRRNRRRTEERIKQAVEEALNA